MAVILRKISGSGLPVGLGKDVYERHDVARELAARLVARWLFKGTELNLPPSF